MKIWITSFADPVPNLVEAAGPLTSSMRSMSPNLTRSSGLVVMSAPAQRFLRLRELHREDRLGARR